MLSAMEPDVTRILERISGGGDGAAAELLPLIYGELRRLAEARMAGEAPGQTLQATALVHEAYLRLLGDTGEVSWEGRAHFFGAAAEAMRRILIDRARAKGTAKRGGSWRRVALDPTALTLDEVPAELLDLDEALERFAAEDRLKARLVELRFFGGLSMAEAAELLGISTATATRHWAFARAWLHHAMGAQEGSEEP